MSHPLESGSPPAAPGGYRLAHFSDIHVTASPGEIPWRALLSKRVLGWLNLRVLGRHAMFAGTGRLLEAFLADLETLAPDHILSTGDLTGLALPLEFEAARGALEPLLDSSRITGIPGNHDVYVKSAEKARLYDDAFGAWTRTDLEAGDLPPDLRALYPYPLVRILGEHVALVAVRDVRPNAFHDSSGRVGDPQLRALRHVLRDSRILSRPIRILATHCGFLRARGPRGVHRDQVLHRLRDFTKLLPIALEGGISLLVHGHTHHRFLCQAGSLTPIPVANPGSLTSALHEVSYNVYTCREDSILVEARRYDRERHCFAPWREAPGTGVVPASR